MLLVALVCVVSSAVAHAEVPLRTDEPNPALVDMGGWQIFAADMSVDGPHISFKDVQATAHGPNQWTLRAERLEVTLAPSSGHARWHATGFGGEVMWMRARGDVRVSGPDDLYVTAEQAVTVQPRRTLEFIDADQPPTAGAAKWRLAARRIIIQLASGRVEYDRPISGTARNERAQAGGIIRPYARNIFRLTGAESAHLNERPTNQE